MYRNLSVWVSRSPRLISCARTVTLNESLAQVGYRQAVYQYVHDVIDDDDQPGGHPGRRVRMKAGFRTLGPRSAAGPGAILQPCDVACEVPAIDDEMCTAYDSERSDVLRDEEKRQQVKGAMHQRRERPLRLLQSHPLALQQVIANRVSYQLIDSKH